MDENVAKSNYEFIYLPFKLYEAQLIFEQDQIAWQENIE